MTGFRLTQAAADDHRRAVLYVRRRNPAAARRLSADLRKTYERLGARPGTSHCREDLTSAPGVRFVSRGSFLVVLRVDVRPIVILRVLHTSRDVARLLRGEEPAEE